MFSLNLLKPINTKFGRILWFNKETLYHSSNALIVLKNCYVNGISNFWLEESKSVKFSSGWYFHNTNGVGMHSSAAQLKLSSATHALGSMKSQSASSSVKSQLMTRFFKTQSVLHAKSPPKCSMRPKKAPKKTTAPSESGGGFASIEDHFSLAMIIKSYQMRGHILAQLDPLKLSPGHIKDIKSYENPVLRDLPLPKNMNAMYMIPNFSKIGGTDTELTLTEVIKRLENAYCGSIGVEYFHNPMFSEVEYIKEVFEYPGKLPVLTKEEKLKVLKKIYETYQFEMFLAKKWPSEKRFGIDGSEVFIPAINHLIEKASEFGAKRFVIGMAHRGRLNLLANLMKMDIPHILAQFQPLKPDSDGTGDVKYHLGTQTTFVHPVTGQKSKISLVSNASHLESQATIVEGKTAAEQIFEENGDSSKVWPILVHGDAAMCGQGIVYETFHLSELNCYTTGGTIHFVINNQIGFTTDPRFSRSSVYCTSVSRITSAPVFHVNGDDVEAVIKATKVAADYRNTYKKDVVIDIVAYRRLGHNEIDEPMFTQPLMYKKVKSMKPVHQKYGEQLIKEKVVTKDEISKMMKVYEDSLEAGYQEAMKQKLLKTGVWVDSPWKGFFGSDKDPLIVPTTGVDETVLTTIGNAISTPPKDFNLHRALVRVFAQRKKGLESGKADWACGEAFAFASLLAEGVFVRLSGQDVERGTFSHRHHVLHDQNVPDKRINVLEKIFPNQATYSLCNSSLSENGVLGFELGMSLVNPKALIIWEAQFGDFCNSAQIIIDQYLSSGESKWIRQVGLVMLLPHGMEGMGPEHSSARIERFLQMCNDDDGEVNRNMPAQLKQANWFVVNCSTPANFFHCLRRQVKLNYRKPLIVFSPKFLLRHPECVSSIEEFTGDTKFLPYLNDPLVKPSSSVKKLLLCSGKVYYELKEERAKKKLDDQIAIGRLEQISPVPYDSIMTDAVTHFPNSRVFWVQEEHRNQGPWAYILPRLTKAIGNEKGPINYIGRDVSSTAGTGYKSVHELERQQFLDVAMTV